MSRPKGSKNKKDEVVEKVEKAEVKAPVKLVGHPIAFSPKPDMGSIKPPELSDEPCENCKHIKGLHYGPTEAPEKTWCNTAGCKCQAFE